MSSKHVVIIPYFSEEEVDRFLKIADCMQRFGPQRCDYEFLLASSPLIQPSERLFDAFHEIAPTKVFACPTKMFGYPQGPTAMFWDCADHLARDSSNDGGFGLWLESDMVPVKPDWLQRIAAEWERCDDPLVMGCFVPDVMKHRFIRRKRPWISEHINGGACYAKNFAKVIPDSYRHSTFDVAIYPFLKENGRFVATPLLAFSTVDKCRSDMADPRKAILHGFLQDKDVFVEKCVQPLLPNEQRFRESSPIMFATKSWLTRMKLRFLKRGKEAMLQALLLEQESLWRSGALDDFAAPPETYKIAFPATRQQYRDKKRAA